MPGRPREYDQAQIVALYALPGASLDSVAAEIGCCVPTVVRYLKQAGVARRPACPPGLNVDVDEMAALYRSGLSQTEVAYRLGVSTVTVRKRMRQHGIPCRHRKRPRSAA